MRPDASGPQTPPREPPGEDRDRNAEPPHDAPPPELMEALRQIGETGRSALGASWGTVKALRELVAADLSLARNAMARASAFAGMAVVFGGTAWMLLMATLVVVLSRVAGWPWWLSMVSCAVVSLLLAGVAVWRGLYYFDLSRLKATRRQLARLGIGELADLVPGPDSPAPTRAAVQTPETPDGQPIKDKQGVELTPP